MTKPRSKQIYIAEDTLWYLTARVKALNGDRSQVDTGLTADQLADDILRQWCKENMKDLVALRERREGLRSEQEQIDEAAVKLALTAATKDQK